MKKLIIPVLLVTMAIVLSGCGKKGGIIDTANQYQAAKEVGQAMNDLKAISSDENVENIFTLMNYSGTQAEKDKMRAAIKQGIDDGGKQGDLDKDLVTTQTIGAGYLLGYTFGCSAATNDEDKCSEAIGQKYQEIMAEQFQMQLAQ